GLPVPLPGARRGGEPRLPLQRGKLDVGRQHPEHARRRVRLQPRLRPGRALLRRHLPRHRDGPRLAEARRHPRARGPLPSGRLPQRHRPPALLPARPAPLCEEPPLHPARPRDRGPAHGLLALPAHGEVRIRALDQLAVALPVVAGAPPKILLPVAGLAALDALWVLVRPTPATRAGRYMLFGIFVTAIVFYNATS